MINLSNTLSLRRPTCVSSLQTFYGLGRTKATKFNHFLLNHPTQAIFLSDFIDVFSTERGKNMLIYTPMDHKIRLFVSYQWQKKISIFCYQAFRLFQSLPTKGQRTKANAGTPYRHNPYTSLKINTTFYHKLEIAYKRKELTYNERFDELKAFNEALIEKEKLKKVDKKEKKKASKETYIKNQKGKK